MYDGQNAALPRNGQESKYVDLNHWRSGRGCKLDLIVRIVQQFLDVRTVWITWFHSSERFMVSMNTMICENAQKTTI